MVFVVDKAALFAAIKSDDVKTIGNLIKLPGFSATENTFHKSSVHDLLPFQWSYMHAAAYHNRPRILEMLLEAGADLEVRDKEHKGTPLGWAAYAGHVESVKFLLEKGADKNVKNKHGKMPVEVLPNPASEAWYGLLTEVTNADHDALKV